MCVMKRHIQYQEGYGAEHLNNTTKVYYRRKGGKIPTELSKEDKVNIAGFIKNLSKAERQVYHYTYVDERRLGQSEVASILGWKSRGAVFNVQKRLIKKLIQLRPFITGTQSQQDASTIGHVSSTWIAVAASVNIKELQKREKAALEN